MICAACGKATPDDPCAFCGKSVLLNGRYVLEEVAGRGSFGLTYRALDRSTGFAVAVKEGLIGGASDRVVALAKREAEVLAQLQHPAIPRFVEAFERGEGRNRSMVLVTEFIHGQNLEEERASRRYTEDDVLDMAEEVLGILRYLHSLSPPVVHRDLKPSNLMRRVPGQRLVLLDFGSVRAALRSHGGSTVAGTFGYMAPEQGVGDATSASDLYALGVVMAVLLTRKDPKGLADRAGRLKWQGHAAVRARTQRLLARMLAPDPDDRPSHAEVRAELRAARKEQPVVDGAVEAVVSEPVKATALTPRRGKAPGPRPGPRPSKPHASQDPRAEEPSFNQELDHRGGGTLPAKAVKGGAHPVFVGLSLLAVVALLVLGGMAVAGAMLLAPQQTPVHPLPDPVMGAGATIIPLEERRLVLIIDGLAEQPGGDTVADALRACAPSTGDVADRVQFDLGWSISDGVLLDVEANDVPDSQQPLVSCTLQKLEGMPLPAGYGDAHPLAVVRVVRTEG